MVFTNFLKNRPAKHKKKHIGQWNGIQTMHLQPTHSRQRQKSIPAGKGQPLQYMALGKLNTYKHWSLSTRTHLMQAMNSKWIRDLNVIFETETSSSKQTKDTSRHWYTQKLFDSPQKHSDKARFREIRLYKKKFLYSKETIRRVKTTCIILIYIKNEKLVITKMVINSLSCCSNLNLKHHLNN